MSHIPFSNYRYKFLNALMKTERPILREDKIMSLNTDNSASKRKPNQSFSKKVCEVNETCPVIILDDNKSSCAVSDCSTVSELHSLSDTDFQEL